LSSTGRRAVAAGRRGDVGPTVLVEVPDVEREREVVDRREAGRLEGPVAPPAHDRQRAQALDERTRARQREREHVGHAVGVHVARGEPRPGDGHRRRRSGGERAAAVVEEDRQDARLEARDRAEREVGVPVRVEVGEQQVVRRGEPRASRARGELGERAVAVREQHAQVGAAAPERHLVGDEHVVETVAVHVRDRERDVVERLAGRQVDRRGEHDLRGGARRRGEGEGEGGDEAGAAGGHG